MSHTPAVLVAGAGPVGMFAALALTRRGVPVRIVDTGLWACSHSYALALHPMSLQLLQRVGLYDKIRDSVYPLTAIGFYDRNGVRAQVRLGAEHSGEAMAVLRQSALEDALQAALEEASCAVQWRHELSAIQANRDHAIATINHIEDRLRGYVVGDADWAVSETNQIAAQFVLGCDGHNSHVRRAAGLDFPEIAPAAYYAVFEFRTDCDLANEVRIVLDERTTDVLWPLPDGYCRWSFQLPEFSDTEAEQLKDKLLAAGFGHYPTRRLKDRVPASVEWGNPPALDTGHLRNLIAERAPWFTGSIDALTWRTVVRFEHRLVNTFGRGRLWLAGDAAHLGAPVGVQSMNLGLLEADDLADRVASVIQGERPISELQKYDDHWTGVWRSLHGVSRTVRPTAEADAWVRERADRLVACLPGYGRSAQLLSRQLGLELADSSVTSV